MPSAADTFTLDSAGSNNASAFSKVSTFTADKNLAFDGNYNLRKTADTIGMATATGALASNVITVSGLENKILVGGVEIVAAFDSTGGDAVSLIIQGGDGAGNFTTISTVIANVDQSTQGVKYAAIDLTDVYVPQIRFVMNPENRTIKSSATGTCNFKLGVGS